MYYLVGVYFSGTTSQTVQQGGQYQHHPSSNTAHQVAEQPTREAPVSKRIKVTISKEQTVQQPI